MKVQYVGPHDKVTVPDAGVVCATGDTVDVDDELGKRLCEQASWKPAPAPKSTKADPTG